MDKWYEIWNKRTPSEAKDVLEGLIYTDGFDSGEADDYRFCGFGRGLFSKGKIFESNNYRVALFLMGFL